MVRAGPKVPVTEPPIDFSHLPKNGVKRVTAFAEQYLLVPQGNDAKKPFRLRSWQQEIVKALIPYRGIRPRQGVITLPRGNGKSALAAVLATYFLFADNVEGAEVLCVATDERQARIVYNRVRRMIELSEVLSQQAQEFAHRIYLPNTDSYIMPLPAIEDALQGYSPTFAVVDELAFCKPETWQAMALASGKREHSLVLGISTPGDNRECVLWDLVNYGRQNPNDKSFTLREFQSPAEAEVTDEDAWKIANPALGDFLSIDALRLDARTAREDNFRRFRMGQWTQGASAWLPADAWDECGDVERVVEPKEPVVLAFDGSISDDCTALTGCTIPKDGSKPHLFVVEIWQRNEQGWTVDRDSVDATVADAFKSLNVQELCADPYGWRAELQRWAKKYGGTRVIEFPSYVQSRMAPFTDALATAVRQQQVTHDCNVTLGHHIANARAKRTVHGDVIVKDRKMSPRKIDAAVTSVMAFGRANWHANNPKKSRRLVAVR